MVDKSELLRVPAFADLPEDQITWFLGHAEELRLKAGDIYFRQGDPADAMFVVMEGQLQARGEMGGETVVFSAKSGDVTGVLPFSRMKQSHWMREQPWTRRSCVFLLLCSRILCRRCRN